MVVVNVCGVKQPRLSEAAALCWRLASFVFLSFQSVFSRGEYIGVAAGAFHDVIDLGTGKEDAARGLLSGQAWPWNVFRLPSELVVVTLRLVFAAAVSVLLWFVINIKSLRFQMVACNSSC